MDTTRQKKTRKTRATAISLAWAGTLAVAFALGSTLRGPGPGVSSPDRSGPRRSAGGLPLSADSRDRPGTASRASRVAPGDTPALTVLPRDRAGWSREVEEAMALSPGPERSEKIIEALKGLGAIDGAAAIEAARKIPELKLRNDAMFAALASWAANDPKAAWAFATAPDDSTAPRGRLWAFFHGLGEGGDPLAALQFVQENQETIAAHRHELGEMIDEIHEKAGLGLLKDWATNLPPGELRDAALGRIVDQWARYDPRAAEQWMRGIGASPEGVAAMRVELVDSWARVDPREAVAWVATLPADARAPQLYDAILRRWMQYDRNGAAQWLAQQPPSAALDRPIERYLWGVMRVDPAGSMAWAESITDDRRRTQMIEQVAELWRRRDPAGLEGYLAESQFPQQIQDHLLRRKPQRR